MSRRKQLSTTHRLVLGPDFANSSRFHSAPFQRQPVNRSTGPRFHSHSVTPSQIAEDRLPRRRERVSFRQVPSAGRPRIRALPKLPPSRRPQNQSDLCRSGQAAGLTPARQPARRRPPSHPAARSRNSAAPRPDNGHSLDQLRAGSRPPQLHRPPAGQPQGSNQAIQGRCDQPSKEGLHAKARLSPRIALTTAGKRRTLTRYAESVAKGTK